jgi:hypothetical protein
MQGFKVVYLDKSGEYRPCIMTSIKIRYGIGKITKPYKGDGPLAVFETKASAREFIIDNFEWSDEPFSCRNMKTFECNYEPSQEIAMWIMGGISSLEIDNFPPGTILADSVTLLREIT